MRFLELHADNFGPLKDQHFEMHSDVFVVVGQNEAGKSSFHAALESILYGFEASSRDKHPLAQFRPGQDLELRAKVQLDNSSILDVRRVLMTQGKLVVTDGEGQEVHKSSNNEALSSMQSVPRTLFQAVYSLTANDTDMQRDDVRGHIRELLLGETGLRGARPITQVRDKVDGDMQDLWREDQRGTPRSKDLRKKLKQARKEQRAAKQADRELREAKRELDGLGPQRETDQRRLGALRTELEELSFHREWHAYLAKQASVDLVDERLVDCPAEWKQEALSNPGELEKTRNKLAHQLTEPRERLNMEPCALSAAQELCIDKEAAIETVLGQVADRKDLLRTAHLAQQGLTESTRGLDENLRRLGADEHARKALAAFPLNTLRADADQWDAELEQFELDSMERAASPLWILGVLIGIGGAVLQGMQLGPAWASLSATVVGFGFAIICFLRPTHATNDAERPGLPMSSAGLLAGLGLQDEPIRSPQALSRIAEQLEDGQQHLASARGHMQDRKEALGELEALESAWKCLAGNLGVQAQDLEALPNELRQAIKLAQQAEREVTQDGHQRETARVQLRGLEPQWKTCDNKLQITRELLATAFPDMADLNQAFEAWDELGRKRVSAKDDQLRLQSNPYFARRSEHGELPTSSDPGELRLAIEALEESTKEQSVRIGELKQRLASDRTAHLARAEETIMALEAELQVTHEQRDELALLAQILKQAEANYRQENEPDVLNKAGEYLCAISQGRYTSLSYPPDDHGHPDEGCLQVHSVEDGLRDVAKPLSRGTQEQIYLALRLGTLDYLDDGREKLPLILDEALVHWDHDRRKSLYAVLETVAKKRQLVLFTCHESFATEVEDAMGARLIRLPERV